MVEPPWAEDAWEQAVLAETARANRDHEHVWERVIMRAETKRPTGNHAQARPSHEHNQDMRDATRALGGDPDRDLA